MVFQGLLYGQPLKPIHGRAPNLFRFDFLWKNRIEPSEGKGNSVMVHVLTNLCPTAKLCYVVFCSNMVIAAWYSFLFSVVLVRDHNCFQDQQTYIMLVFVHCYLRTLLTLRLLLDIKMMLKDQQPWRCPMLAMRLTLVDSNHKVSFNDTLPFIMTLPWHHTVTSP